MSEAAHQEVIGRTVPVLASSSYEALVPNPICRAVGITADDRLKWELSLGGEPLTGFGSVNPTGGSVRAVIPADVRRALDIGPESSVNWRYVGGPPASVLHVGSDRPPAEVRVVNGDG